MMYVIRIILTALLLLWVATGSRTALVLTLALQAVTNELLVKILKVKGIKS